MECVPQVAKSDARGSMPGDGCGFVVMVGCAIDNSKMMLLFLMPLLVRKREQRSYM
jgi:hypothetical protein